MQKYQGQMCRFSTTSHGCPEWFHSSTLKILLIIKLHREPFPTKNRTTCAEVCKSLLFFTGNSLNVEYWKLKGVEVRFESTCTPPVKTSYRRHRLIMKI